MTRQDPQSPGKTRDTALIDLLNVRRGQATTAILHDGARFTFTAVGYGYDLGDQFANLVPEGDNDPRVLFRTNEIAQLLDADDGRALFRFPL